MSEVGVENDAHVSASNRLNSCLTLFLLGGGGGAESTLMNIYNCAKGHLPKCIINDFMAVGLIPPPPNTRLHQKTQYEWG